MTGLLDLFKTVLASWRRHPLRSILTTLGIVIAVMTVVTILSLVGGLDTFVREEIGALGANSFVISRSGIIQSEAEWLEASKRPLITLDEYESLIRKLKGRFLYSSPWVRAWLNVEAGGEELRFIRTQGVGADMYNINERPLEQGRYFTDAEVTRRRPVAVLGYEVAGELFGGADPLGREVRVGGRTFTVVGVYVEQGRLMGQSTDDFVDIPYTAFRKHFGYRHPVNIYLRAHSQEELSGLMYEAEQAFRAVRRLEPGEPNNFGVVSEKLLVSVFEQMTGVIFGVMIVVGGISLIVGGIGIMNVMLVAVSERTREIGIRKAVGAKRSDILRQFLTEALLVTAVGGVIGVGLGALVGHLIGGAVELPVEVSVGSVVLAMAFCGIVGVSFGIFPALKAARLDPIVALQKT
jgi:putative ABC transport system permease protein